MTGRAGRRGRPAPVAGAAPASPPSASWRPRTPRVRPCLVCNRPRISTSPADQMHHPLPLRADHLCARLAGRAVHEDPPAGAPKQRERKRGLLAGGAVPALTTGLRVCGGSLLE